MLPKHVTALNVDTFLYSCYLHWLDIVNWDNNLGPWGIQCGKHLAYWNRKFGFSNVELGY